MISKSNFSFKNFLSVLHHLFFTYNVSKVQVQLKYIKAAT